MANQLNAVGQAAREGLPLDAGDVRLASRAIEALRLAGDPRLAAYAERIQTLIDDGSTRKSDRLAERLTKVSKAAMEAGPLGSGDRADVAKATEDAQAAYLAEMSPAAYASWERAAREAGRAA